MTLPVFVVEAAVLAGCRAGDVVRLDGAEGRHAVTVRRTRVGEWLTLTDGAGTRAAGEVVAIGRDLLDLRVDSLATHAPPSPRFVLVQALAKGGRDDQAVEAATECGVDEVVPWQAARSIVQWRGERGERARRAWEAVIGAASKQSRRHRRPVLGPTASTVDVEVLVRAASLALVLHEAAADPLATVTLPSRGDVLVIVGPEGGVAPEEVAALVGAGARVVRLGENVLRSSSAGPAALAVLSAMGRWR
jgi:16S rRNA (uracil1498-N3)-methyltransferase